jgi:hypothetical protein
MADDTLPSAQLVSALAAFSNRHGGATAVLEHTGRRGIRITLVGADGRWGDLMAATTQDAAAACAAAEVPVAEGWGRELADSVRTSGYEWGLMGRNRPAKLGAEPARGPGPAGR